MIAALSSPHTLYTLLCALMVLVISTMGDNILSLPLIRNRTVFKALVDSSTHAFIGGWGWIVATGQQPCWSLLGEASLCTMFAAAIDVDHFIAAHSFQLQAALSLQHRPFLHNSTIILILLLASLTIRPWLYRLAYIPLVWYSPWMIFVAISTHHLRDASRRGLWLAPFGSTKPLHPPWLYRAAILLVLIVVRAIVKFDSPPMKSTSNQQREMILDV